MKEQLQLFREAWSEFTRDKAQRLAAALAYYTIFSIAPLLVISVAVAGLIFGKSQAQAQIITELRSLFGPAGGKAIQEMLEAAAKPKESKVAIVLGFATLFFGAAGVFGQLKDAMNTIWNVKPKEGGGIAKMIKDRFLSFAMVLGVLFLLLVSLVIDAGVAAMGKFASSHIAGGEALWQIVQLAVSFCVITVLFAMIFRFLPDVRIEWHDVWYGAAFTSLLFVMGKLLLGIWLGKGTVGSAYGAAGSLVVLIVWIYWSANILFFGAEFTEVFARRHGSHHGEKKTSAQPERPRVLAPAPAYQPATRKASAIPVVAGGAVGLAAGALLGGLSAVLIFFKSLKKLFT
jgi:membrane protein